MPGFSFDKNFLARVFPAASIRGHGLWGEWRNASPLVDWTPSAVSSPQKTSHSPMPTRNHLEFGKVRPLRLFLIILAVLFTIEAIVMFVLPHIIPPESTVTFGAMIDACLLTVVLAPMLWLLIIKPLQNLAATRQRLLAQALSAQENERRRIARDLHDSLGQSLTSLMVGLRVIEESSTEVEVQSQARELRRIGSATHDDVRRLARGLRPAILDDVGLVPALERFLQELGGSHQIETSLDVSCQDQSRLPESVETSVFRIVQEAASNAIRHGKAQHLRIKLSRESNYLNIEIDDDGCGFNVASSLKANQMSSPFGLLSIRERACLLAGEAIISSQPGVGTHVQVHIPLSPPDGTHG
jgi:signal transduction histidine kinase